LAVWILEKAGYEVDIASTGIEAVSLFAKNKYDLILMDIEMPEMDGFQATVEIRKRENGSSIPIIALTAHAIEGYREKCLSFGMNDYLTKPLRREHLLRTIRHFVSSDMSEFENDEESGTTVYVDEDLMDLIPVYLENCHTNITLLNDAMTAFDFDAIRRIGHNLKGSGQGYGFEKLSVFGKLLEDDANERNMESIKSTVADLVAYLGQVKVASK
jgi:CheY-like chemotaxis protein/HPt (histidine-containing phosphotransfer) domain-containing protein